MGSNNLDFYNGFNGPGLDLWYQKRPYVDSNDSWTPESVAVGSHTFDSSDSDIVTSIFKRKGGKTISRFVKSNLNNNKNADVNDTSLMSTIAYLQKWKSTYVNYSDFAYLKNIGVYPSNRLMIARRFSAAVGNNLYNIDADPLATMIGWVPDNTDFFSISFGEVWEAGDTSFLSLMNTMGQNWNVKGAGDFVEKFVSPFPGYSEAIQIKVAKELGIAGKYDTNNPPLGNPNLVLESKKRALLNKEKDTGGSGLSSTFTIKFVVEYEQKYINDVDPSLIYLDIIQKGLIFGTSKSVFYFGGESNSQFNQFFKNLVSGDALAIAKALYDLGAAIGSALKKVFTEAVIDPETGQARDASEIFTNFVKNTLGQLVSRYRTRLYSVIQSLTGAPSGCWHVTIGNPRKPIFSSGDLLIGGADGGSVTMTLGKQLSYNDLPSSIKFEFSLSPARNLGGQEIFDRFNTGVGRTYFQDIRSWVEIPLSLNTDADRTYSEEGQKSDSLEKRLDVFKEELKETKNNQGYPVK